MSSNLTPIMGGLDALVAAASAAKHDGGRNNPTKRQRTNDPMRPQQTPTMDPTMALLEVLTNPTFISALAATTQNMPMTNISGANPYSPYGNSQYQPQLQADATAGGSMSAPTPFQQTRSGRISRPPAQPQYDLLSALAAQADTPYFEAILQNASKSGDANGSAHQTQQHHQQRSSSSNRSRTGGNKDQNNWGNQGGHTLAEMSGEMSRSVSPEPGDLMDGQLPEWPLPPGGPGGRKNMPKEELLARRRARNRIAAIESRKKRKNRINEIETRMRDREYGYIMLQRHCKTLEEQVEQLQQIIVSAGLSLPASFPKTNPFFTPEEFMQPSNDFSAAPAGSSGNETANGNPFPAITDDTPGTFASVDESPLPPLDMFFNIDMDGEDDGEFLPPSSPVAESDNEESKRARGKGKKRAREDDEDDDDFSDDEVEDEDLFLPIEDVPVPPDAQMESAMRSLGVDNQEQLASLINKMVVAGKEGMTSEMVDKLKVLISLVGPNGSWSENK